MKTLSPGDRFELGDRVTWLHVSGEECSGDIIDIVIQNAGSAYLAVNRVGVADGRLVSRVEIVTPERVTKAFRNESAMKRRREGV